MEDPLGSSYGSVMSSKSSYGSVISYASKSSYSSALSHPPSSKSSVANEDAPQLLAIEDAPRPVVVVGGMIVESLDVLLEEVDLRESFF